MTDLTPTPEAAFAMGQAGGPPSEAERLAFEAWMRGHCWQVVGNWDGTTYVTDAERQQQGWVDHWASVTRQLWAAWRDRAALAEKAGAGPTEVAELAAWLRTQGVADSTKRLYHRAADLLESTHPRPIPVAERPWERPGFCDDEHCCWAIGQRDNWTRVYVPGRNWSNPAYTHVLAAAAIPLPERPWERPEVCDEEVTCCWGRPSEILLEIPAAAIPLPEEEA